MLNNLKNDELPDTYLPSINEEFMNEIMLLYFKKLLINWRSSIFKEYFEFDEDNTTLSNNITHEDPDTELNLNYLKRMVDYSIINKINSALERIENGTYGYCIRSGRPIAIKRLENWPLTLYYIHDAKNSIL